MVKKNLSLSLVLCDLKGNPKKFFFGKVQRVRRLFIGQMLEVRGPSREEKDISNGKFSEKIVTFELRYGTNINYSVILRKEPGRPKGDEKVDYEFSGLWKLDEENLNGKSFASFK
ncbi:MAG: hypothetical protein PHE24_02020 [Patescibacteria group bacterium]|nr:hypothetical protein [Patescibacteria group bacterium]